MTKCNTIFDLVPGKLYKHTWIDDIQVPDSSYRKRMPYRIESDTIHDKLLDINKILLFVGSLTGKENQLIKLNIQGNGRGWGLFLYENKIIAMQHYSDIHYKEVGT